MNNYEPTPLYFIASMAFLASVSILFILIMSFLNWHGIDSATEIIQQWGGK